MAPAIKLHPDHLAPTLPGADGDQDDDAVGSARPADVAIGGRPGALFAAIVLAPGLALACGGLASLAVALFSR